jgi:LysM domain
MSRWTSPEPTTALRLSSPMLPQRPTGAGVRLTQRGRVLVVLFLMALLTTAFVAGRSASQAATTATPKAPLPQTTVQAGDTLWSVAQRTAPGHDPRDVVAQIRRLNHLETGNLRVGQQLVLPRSA